MIKLLSYFPRSAGLVKSGAKVKDKRNNSHQSCIASLKLYEDRDWLADFGCTAQMAESHKHVVNFLGILLRAEHETESQSAAIAKRFEATLLLDIDVRRCMSADQVKFRPPVRGVNPPRADNVSLAWLFSRFLDWGEKMLRNRRQRVQLD